MTGAPSVRRVKNYSAQTGYVYRYCYEGYRPSRSGPDISKEYLFQISSGGKRWRRVLVLVAEAAVRAWEQAHARTLSPTEQYAIAKLALFQAFDERATPALMKHDVRVRAADIEAIAETLGIEPED